MTTTVNLRKLLHRKSWEMCTPCLSALSVTNTSSGSFVVSDKYNVVPDSLAFFVQNAAAIYRYDGNEDAWVQLPGSGLPGTFAAGACGEFKGLGAMGGTFTQAATGGSAGSIITSKTIARSLVGRRLRVVAGTGMGFDGLITENTIGASAVIQVNSTVVFDVTTQFQIFSGSLWFMNAGTTAVGFGVYDLATNAWTTKSVTNLPVAWGTEGQLISALGMAAFASGTATSATTGTLTNTAKSWQTNQWANYQVRITAGTGKGQLRAIASNTATVLTIATAWTIMPDATSVYSLEANDDCLYLLGNATTALYKFTVSTNTWAVLTPTTPRAAAAGAGCSCNFIDNVSGWDLQAGDIPKTLSAALGLYKQNGRFLFSFRGGATNVLDIYDVALNTWVNAVAYGNQQETFTTGSCSLDFDGDIYLQKEATGRIFRFSVADFVMQAFAANPGVQAAVVAGMKMFMLPYVDGGTKINFLYTQRHTGNELYRMLVI